MDTKGVEGYESNTSKWGLWSLGNLVGIDKLGRRACFHALCLHDFRMRWAKQAHFCAAIFYDSNNHKLLRFPNY